MIKRIIAQTAGVAVLGAAIAASAQAAEFNLKMHHFLPAKAPAHAKFF